MATGYLREAFEDTPGNESNTPTLSTKKLFPPLQSYGPKLGPNPMLRDDELRNLDEPVPAIPDAYEPSWEYASRAYPDLLGFRLKHILGNPTTTAGDGIITDPGSAVVPTGAQRHVWAAPFGPSGASPLTVQQDVAYRDQSVFFKLKGAACGEMSIESPEEGGVTVAASGPANYMARQSDPSLTPTYEALTVRPFVRGGLTLPTWLTGTGTHENFSVTITNPVEAVRSLGIASKFPDVMEKDNEGSIVVTGSVPQRQLDADDWDALVANTGFTALAQWVSDSIIAAAYPYKLFVAFSNAQYVEGEPEELKNQRRHGAEFSFRSTTPSSGSTTITLVNATTSYA